MDEVPQRTTAQASRTPAWGAVISMALGVFGLVTAEFLPASLLTPMAQELEVSEGMAGQAVTATAVVALITSLLVSAATRNIDRRHVLLGFTVLLMASNLMVAFAPDIMVLLVGRVLLGIGLGGFWTMSTAVAMRLVPDALVPRALSMIVSGVAAATIIAAPVGSYVGDMFGWRSVFLLGTGLGAITFVVQFATLPSMAPNPATRLRTLLDVLVRPGVGLGLLSAMLVFAGHFAFFTYIRPHLENITDASITAVSGMLLGFGLANFLGSLFGGFLVERSLRRTLMTVPLVLSILGFGLISVGSTPAASAVMIALWGLAFGAVPVGWSTWLARTVPDQAESAGGLLVAAIQLAIALGAAGGGLIFDTSGAQGVFSAASIVLVLAAAMIFVGVRPRAVIATA
ncbi:MFS transporter [Nitratireductor sp.]|uniref:MFS transporter n=1 Tax=Nitratireductor sp. TaxID=1872084 RepID=UPI0025EBD56E|nr:MFS transporter [Nitratireductor sp.]